MDPVITSWKTRILVYRKLIIISLLITLLLIYVYYTHLNYHDSSLAPTSNTKSVNKTIYVVNRYKFLNDFLELNGQYTNGDEKHSSSNKETTLQLKGIENLLHQIKPALLMDSKLEKAILPHERLFRFRKKIPEVNCNMLFKGEKTEMERATKLLKEKSGAHEQITAEEYIKLTTKCVHFVASRGYITSPLTKVEEDFPIAFSILIFKDLGQFERLLRAIYRPQNFYCIHVDKKTNDTIFQAVAAISGCFNNVFVTQDRFDVKWGEMSVLEPDLSCMRELWGYSKTWKYFINLTGQEFPLRTNYELVQILKAYNGANDIECTVKHANKDRWENAGQPPHGIKPVKGSVHIVVGRGYVDFMLHDPRAADLLNWTRKTSVPDETYFATLNHNPSLNVPGSYRGLPETDQDIKPFVARFKNWGNGNYDWPCGGKRVRMICIFGIRDLPMLATRRELFANKFHLDYERYALDCMEELHFNRTRDEYLGKLTFDSRWYAKLGFVLNKVES